MRIARAIGLTLVLAPVLFIGCETFSPDNDEGGNTTALEDYGGFTTGDEEPGFGDAGLLSSYTDEEPFDDEMERHPEVSDANRNGGARHYMLRIAWGNLDHPDTLVNPGEDCPVTDWSGLAVVDGGVLIVKRLIRFELRDEIIRPRKGPRAVAWTSHTMNGLDGIVFKIVDVPDPGPHEAENTVTLTTPFYSAVIPLEDLEDYQEFVTYDDCNKLSVVATEINPQDCPRGFLRGRWVVETDTSGHFVGGWIASEGDLAGYLRGRYAVREDKRVLYGKWITSSGEFGGLFRGTWLPLDLEEGPDGYFQARWVDHTFTITGAFKGHYCISEDDTSGFFHGRWKKHCR